MSSGVAVRPVRVFVVDDRPVVRDGLRALLARDGMAVVGDAADAESALAQLRTQDVDVVLTGVRLPGMGGLELCQQVVSRGSETAVVIWSGVVDGRTAGDAFEAGAMAFLAKDVPPSELSRAIAAAAQGERHVSDHAERDGATDGHAELAAAQIELLRLFSRGRSVSEVANTLAASPHTIRARLRRIYRRLGCSNRSEAIGIAFRRGML